MVMKLISDRLGDVISPIQEEVRLAQQEALKRIQNVLTKAEDEVLDKAKFMSSEQRMDMADKEMQKAEEHLLNALSSVYKAMVYIAPQINPFNNPSAIKEVKGRVVDE